MTRDKTGGNHIIFTFVFILELAFFTANEALVSKHRSDNKTTKFILANKGEHKTKLMQQNKIMNTQ